MASRTGQEIRLKQYAKGMPTEDIFELAKVDVPEPKEGEFLVRNIWMSVDPYMRGRMRSPQETKSYISSFQLNKPLDDACVGQIIESKNKEFTVGEYVLGDFGWREYWISNGNDILKINSKIAPIQSFLGVLGMTGLTAYVGLLKIGELNEGKDTVFVSAASGAVGSIVSQIGKIKGCHVVGSAGSEEKVEWLLDEAKIDYAFNYKNIGENNNISSELKKACPEGIDLYFDNVGGKHLEAAIDNMKTFGAQQVHAGGSAARALVENTLQIAAGTSVVNSELSLVAQNVSAATGGSQAAILRVLQQIALQTASWGGGPQVQKFVTNVKNSVAKNTKHVSEVINVITNNIIQCSGSDNTCNISNEQNTNVCKDYFVLYEP
jgi:NADPH-dependent curcumin reductase CurA